MIGSILSLRRTRSKRQALSTAMALLLAVSPISMAYADSTTAPAAATTPPPAAAPTPVPGINTIALFQSANEAGASGEVAASALDSAVKLRLNASGVYQSTEFSTLLPAVQRALTVDTSDAALSDSDIQQPVTSTTSAQKIAKIMDTQGYLLEEIDQYSEDANSHAVSITVSGTLYNTSTGEAARTFAVTGAASPSSSDEPDSSVMLSAINNAADQISTTLGIGSSASSVVPGTRIGSSGSGSTVILVLLAAALAGVIAHNVAAHGNAGSSSGGSSSTGSGGGGPPPPP